MVSLFPNFLSSFLTRNVRPVDRPPIVCGFRSTQFLLRFLLQFLDLSDFDCFYIYLYLLRKDCGQVVHTHVRYLGHHQAVFWYLVRKQTQYTVNMEDAMVSQHKLMYG